MGDSLTLDFGSAIPYLVDGVLGLFGRDADSQRWKAVLNRITRLSAEQSAQVQCVGMRDPIPIQDIYQPLGIQVMRREEKVRLTFEQLINDDSAIIFAGPGRGKTTLLHWAYMHLLNSKAHLPVLFTLRWPDGAELLTDFVSALASGKTAAKRSKELILLVDGYDEIEIKQRQTVSQALMMFNSLGLGKYYLSCRSYYDVFELKVQHAELSPFVHIDAVRFVTAYSNASGIPISPEPLLRELYEHGFEDFASHPLMLALICILQSSPEREIPRRAIGLIERAIQTLTLRWDQSKGIQRQSDIPVDGYERVRCLTRIAYDMVHLDERWEVVESSVRRHLKLIQVKGVDPRVLLREIAQWYGVLVPSSDQTWQFVHRTLHDYLAARFWVDSGGFGSEAVPKWTTRAAYATCILPDATKKLIDLLSVDGTISVFRECLYNRVAFDVDELAEAVLARVHARGQFRMIEHETGIQLDIVDDFFDLATDEFLRALIIAADKQNKPAAQVVALYALGEMAHRKQKISRNVFNLHLLTLCNRIHGATIELKHQDDRRMFHLTDVVTS